MPPPPSRLAPCPCGSGKRYKECHGALAAPAADTTTSADDPVAKTASEVEAWIQLGEASLTADPDAAEAAWRRALDIAPANAEAHFHLGNLYRGRGDPRGARHEYERALESAPGHAGVLNNLGLAFEASGAGERAESCYREVLAANPTHSDALGNLASLLFEREAYRQSAAMYERLFAIRQDVPAPVWVRRAMAHQRIGELESAEACFREAARLLPDDLKIQQNIGTICHEQQRYGDAEPSWLRALALRPDNSYALSMLAHGRAHRCDWRGLSELHGTLNRLLESEAVEGDDRVNPFALLAMPTSPTAQLRAAQRWARGVAPTPRAARPPRPIAAGNRLRVGFASSDFRPHPMMYLSVNFWERIDRDRIETFAYGIRERDDGPVGQRVARAFEHFADVSQASADEIARRIRADRIDILIDLNGYTLHSRERIFALRPAPIQINYLGYEGPMGAEWYDYILVDRFAAPESLQPYFMERLLRLPNASFPSDTGRAPKGPPPTRAECGLPADAFVFCCFNSAYKILPEVFATWMHLLCAVPASVLWLIDAGSDAIVHLRREAGNAGVDPDRLIFAPRMDAVERHVARIAVADLVVDSFPYGAHTTANDALLVGVPLVTRAGDTLVSRIAGSQLHAIGLPELVTSTPDEYETLALRLARDPGALGAFAARLAANRHTHPLFDMARFTREVEDCLCEVWRDSGEAPEGTPGPHG